MNYGARLPVVSGVSDGSLAAHAVALQHVEGVVPVRVVPRLQQLPAQVGLLIKGAQQLALLLSPRQLGHLQNDGETMKRMFETVVPESPCWSSMMEGGHALLPHRPQQQQILDRRGLAVFGCDTWFSSILFFFKFLHVFFPFWNECENKRMSGG